MKDGVVSYMQSSALLLFIFPPAEEGGSWSLVKKLLKGGRCYCRCQPMRMKRPYMNPGSRWEICGHSLRAAVFAVSLSGNVNWGDACSFASVVNPVACPQGARTWKTWTIWLQWSLMMETLAGSHSLTLGCCRRTTRFSVSIQRSRE